MLIWYLARGAGIAAFAMLSVATGAGALATRRPAGVGRRGIEARVIVQYVHRAAALGGLLLLVVHVSMLLADPSARVGVTGALLPFASGYRPLAVTLGLLAMYLLIAVAVSGLLRSRFARSARAARLWRGIHLASYSAWAMAAWHFLATGTDAGRWWARIVFFSGVAIVTAGVAVRLTGQRQPPRQQKHGPSEQATRRPEPLVIGAGR